MTSQYQRPALLGLGAWLLAAGCGAGVAGVVASSGSSGGRSSAPAIVNLRLSETKRSPARIEFELQNAGASVELRYHRPGDPAGTFSRMEHVSGLAANPASLAPGAVGIDWDFRAENGIDPTGAFEPEVEIEVAILGQTTGSQRIGGGVGNDLPRITSAAADVDPVAGEVSGIVLIEATLEDTSGDRANLRVEFSLDGTSWQLARPAQDETTPPFAFTNVVAELGGTSVPFFWDTADDLGDADTDALLRFVPFEDVEGTLEQGTLLASAPFHLDNNAAPIVQLFNDVVVTNPDERRGIPIPFKVIDEESDLVEVILQWRRDGEEFPELPEAELDAILADPIRRREKHICTEYPRFATGRVLPIDATNVRLPELALGSESWILASGLEGRTLELLRVSSIPAPITPSWGSNPLVSPVAAIPIDDGLTALVLDAPGPGRLREIELATGVIVREIATLGPGIPSAMTAEVLPGGDPSRPAAVLVALDDAGVWRIERVELTDGALTELIASDGTEVGPVRGIASLGTNAAVFTAGSALFFLDYRAPFAPRLATLLSDLAAPFGVVVDPLATNQIYVAERDANRILAIELESHKRVAVVSMESPQLIEHPQAIALENRATRLLVITNTPASTFQLIGLELDAKDGNVAFSVGATQSSEIRSIATGLDGLRLAVLADELLVGGGMEQRRRIVAYEHSDSTRHTGQRTVLDGDLEPEARPGQTWRVPVEPRVRASPGGLNASFVWNSSLDLPAGSRAFLRAVSRDNELGPTADGIAAKALRAALDVEPLALGGPTITNSPLSVAAADIDGDGSLDLVSANSGSDNLTVFFQDSAGSFANPPFPLGGAGMTSDPVSVVAGDLDGDFDLDLVSTNLAGNNLTVFLQDFHRSFASMPLTIGGFATTFGPQSVVAADLDGDSDLDLVSANQFGDTLTVFFQGSPGSFAISPLALGGAPTTDGPASVASADLDGDGDLDLASANEFGHNLTVFFQDSPGAFVSQPLVLGGFPTTNRPASIASADLDGDGDMDLVSANSGFFGSINNNLTAFFQDMPGQFASQPLALGGLSTTVGPTSVAAADLDRDGDIDIVSANTSGHDLTVFFGSPPGTFGSTPVALGGLSTTIGPSSVAAGDLDEDGDLDIVSANSASDNLTVFFPDSSGIFASTPVSLGGFLATPAPQSITAADLDGDGDIDLVSANGSIDGGRDLTVLFQESSGSFVSSLLPLTRSHPRSVATADFDGDGDLELVSANSGTGNLTVFFQALPGAFASPPIALGGPGITSPNSVAAADLDGDGDIDLVSANLGGNSNLTVFFQALPGAFASPPSALGGIGITSPNSVVAADFDDDGNTDLVSTNQVDDNMTVFFQSSPGNFASKPLVVGGPSSTNFPLTVTAADLDGDGDLDLVSANVDSDNMTVFFQESAGRFATSPLKLGGVGITDDPSALATADLDGDGDVDLASANRAGDDITVFPQQFPGSFIRSPLTLGGVGVTRAPVSLAAVDLDGDGDSDFVSTNSSGSNLVVFWGGR